MKTKKSGAESAIGALEGVGGLATDRRSVFQPSTYGSFGMLPEKTILVREDGDHLTVRKGRAELGAFWSSKDEMDVQIHFDKDRFAPEDGFFHDFEGRGYYVLRFGSSDQEQELAESIAKVKALDADEKTAFGTALNIAREKGEVLAKVYANLSAGQYRDWLASVSIPKATADVYTRLAHNWDSIHPNTQSIADAIRQIAKQKKETKGEAGESDKSDKPRLQVWEQKVVDVAKELKVRGSHSNLIRFLAKFGVSEDQIKTVLG